MSSLKQIDANRRNALKSTGPTTVEGKLRSRSNAIRHGLTAETVIATLEDSDDYEAFQTAVASDYEAESAVERELVLRIASVLWRLRRSTLIETALFERAAENPGGQEHDSSQSTPDGPVDISNRREVFLRRSSARSAVEEAGRDSNSKQDIAHCFLQLADLPKCAHVRLGRYEQMLWRQARQLVLTLDTLRRRKRQPHRPSFPFRFR